MTLDLRQLLDLPVWRAFDVDDTGRILAGFDGSGTIQLVELAPDGTPTHLTALPGACSGRYLPGTRTVVVQHDEGGDEKAQLSLLDLDPAPAEPVALAGLRRLVRDERYIHELVDVGPGRIVYSTNRRNGVDFDVVVHELADGRETVVYDGGGWVDGAQASPDGRSAAVVVAGDLAMSDQLLLADSATGAVRELTGKAEHAIHQLPQWTPDGRALIVTTNRGREFTGVARLDLESGEWSWLVVADGFDLSGRLSPDGGLLLVSTNDDGVTRLAVHDAADGRRLRDVAAPDGLVGEFPLPPPVWSADSRYVTASFSSWDVPGDILLIDAHTGEVSTVATSTGPLAGHTLSEPESHRVPAHDGEEIPCFVFRPNPEAAAASEVAGSAVLIIHGGPEGQAAQNFWVIPQALAAAGHTVLMPNVRGSVGYGKRWYSADDVCKRLDSVADLASLHAWLPTVGVDPTRAALYGGSYGGYMVLAGLAFQPELWAAGVDIVGISSLVTFLENTSAYRRSHREREYGSLEHDREFLEEASPLNRIDDIRGALFIIHGANDPRVPLSEAEQVAERLGANGVPCEMLVYGDEGHGLAKRVNRLDAYPKALAFLAEHLAG